MSTENDSVWMLFSLRAGEVSCWTGGPQSNSVLQQGWKKGELLTYLCLQGSLFVRYVRVNSSKDLKSTGKWFIFLLSFCRVWQQLLSQLRHSCSEREVLNQAELQQQSELHRLVIHLFLLFSRVSIDVCRSLGRCGMFRCLPILWAVFVCRDFGSSSEREGLCQNKKRQVLPAPQADREDGGQRTDAGTRSGFICLLMKTSARIKYWTKVLPEAFFFFLKFTHLLRHTWVIFTCFEYVYIYLIQFTYCEVYEWKNC